MGYQYVVPTAATVVQHDLIATGACVRLAAA